MKVMTHILFFDITEQQPCSMQLRFLLSALARVKNSNIGQVEALTECIALLKKHVILR